MGHARMAMALRNVAACVVIGAGLLNLGVARVSTNPTSPDTELSTAICPVVYQLDESSSARGYHYIFYGNAFFVDREGYLITAAHVLSDFHDGGQPCLLLRLPEAPPRLLKAEVVSMDVLHDVAVLRATPNPFEGKYQVSFLALDTNKPSPGVTVLAAALRPSRLKDPHTFDAPQEDYSTAQVLQYTSSALFKSQTNTELFLFSHEVIRGQSGAPVVAEDGQQRVVGIVEGRWLRPTSSSVKNANGVRNSAIGAAIPISYAIPLLEEKHIPWQAASSSIKPDGK
jgi:S1-C subfamily serine protease